MSTVHGASVRVPGTNSPHGCLLVSKPAGISSFGVIEALQRALLDAAKNSGLSVKKRDLPKFGHGGTLDPFATGLLIVCVGDGTKLSRYFLGSTKEYRARVRFGATTIPGDPTAPVAESCETIPASLGEIRRAAVRFTQVAYLQVPPMHSAKKIGGKVLYELAREGVEVERAPSEVRIHEFEILDYSAPVANIRVRCSSGTYIRVLGQDLGRRLGSLAYLETLERTRSGKYNLENTQSLDALCERLRSGEAIDKLSCFIPFDRMLDGFPALRISETEALQIRQGLTRVIALFEASEIQSRLEARAADDSAYSSETRAEVVSFRDEKGLVAVFSRVAPSNNQGESTSVSAASSSCLFRLDRVFPPH